MLGERWITDRVPTERFAYYTRANAGEVLADPVSPLGWTFCWESGIVLGCRDGFVSFGVFDPDEYGDPPETFGLFGGYFYNSLTQARLMGVRMPGASAEAIDAAYFDEHPDVPPYVEEDWHDSPEHAAKLAETMGYVMSGVTHRPVEDQKEVARADRDSRPDLSTLSDADLVARAQAVQPHLVSFFEQHVWASLGASLGPGALQAITAELGRPDDAVALLTGVGDVDSAEIAGHLWELSRSVRRSPELTAAFDAGLDGLSDRTAGTELEPALAEFVYVHGSRGPNEWDPAADTYETSPALTFAQLDVMRRQDDSASPRAAFERGAAERARIAAEIEAALAGDQEALDGFRAAMASSAVWVAARERSKGNNIRSLHETRMAFDELGRRATSHGHLAHPKQIYMLVEAELDDFVADPASLTSTLAEREADFAELGKLVPPFIVNTVCPPLSEWKRRDAAGIISVAAGDSLRGVACSPGTATGVARIVLDASDPSALEPGDILVTRNTDPSWTPLFLAAGAVVTNVGALNSHASIVSRELGIPCVASVADATDRIPDGATLTVDGSAGTVSVDAVP